jgi:DNA invertase Pin-like site-specific DNA recombinase
LAGLPCKILASLTEYNRNLILEGCKAGIEVAKKRGVKFGRQKGTKMKKPKKEAIIQLYKSRTTVSKIEEITGIKSRLTVYNYLFEENIQPNRK